MEIDWKRAWYFITQILSILSFVFSGYLIASMVGFVTGKLFFGYNMAMVASVVDNPVEDPRAAMFLRIFQMLMHFGVFALPVFIYMLLYKYPVFGTLKLTKSFSFSQGLLIVLFAFAALFGLFFLSDLNQQIPLPEGWREVAERMSTSNDKMINSMMFMPTVMHLLSNLFIVGFIAAFGEELMFRGLLQPLFKNWTMSIHWGIIISAALFSAVHSDINGFLPRMVIGIAFGYLFYWTGNLWVTILAHFLNNSIEILLLYFKDSNSWCNYFVEVKYMPLAWGITGILVALVVMYIFKQRMKVEETSIK
jgi:membrane protease YdiL (CAAX protease family)